jgi:hypothetical protein
MKISITLGLFIGGFASFALYLAVAGHPQYFALLGWIVWVFAYFSILIRNFTEKAPIPTRGGSVQYEDRPRLYKLIYSFLFFAGIFVLLVLILLNLSSL